MARLYIGIDPDREKSGVAVWDRKNLVLYNFSFFELYDYLLRLETNMIPIADVLVVIEAGWLNKKSNWHDEHGGVRVASKIGANTGANHETGKKIVEMCDYLHIPCTLSVPKTSKYKALQFEMLTKYHGKTNQETRDAAMLVFGL